MTRGFFSSFLSSSVKTRSRVPSATDAMYQPLLLVSTIFELSRLNGPTENDSGFLDPAADRRRIRLSIFGVIDRGFSRRRAGRRPAPFSAHANTRPIVGPARVRRLERLRVDKRCAAAASAAHLQVVLRAGDDVVVGLLGRVLTKGDERAIARQLVVGELGLRQQRRAHRRSRGSSAASDAQAVGAAQRVPVEKRLLRGVHDDRAVDQLSERGLRRAVVGGVAQRHERASIRRAARSAPNWRRSRRLSARHFATARAAPRPRSTRS